MTSGSYVSRLISEVRRNPCLYNSSRADYLDRQKKEKTWDAIANVLHVKRADAMQRWRSLRDRYCRELKNSTTASTSRGDHHPAGHCKPPFKREWPLFQSLDFLRSSTTFRKTTVSNMVTTRNLDDSGTNNADQSHDDEINPAAPFDTPSLSFPPRIVRALDAATDKNLGYDAGALPPVDAIIVEEESGNDLSRTSWLHTGQENSWEEPVEVEDELLELLRATRERMQNAAKEPDDVHYFLMSLGSRMRALAPKEKLKVQMRILQVLIDAEEAAT